MGIPDRNLNARFNTADDKNLVNFGPVTREFVLQAHLRRVDYRLADFDFHTETIKSILMKLNFRTTPDDYPETKFDFDPTTWVVRANTQFAVRFLCLFWSLRHAHRSHQT